MKLLSRIIGVSLGAGILAAFILPAVAQTNYPNRTIEYIVPYRPGGLSDTVVRLHARELERMLGQTVVVRNVTGGGGAVGFVEAMNAKPDGYTISHASSDLPRYRIAGLAEVGAEDFVILGGLAATSPNLMVHADSPWKTIEEFVADAKKNPGKYKIGVTDIGGYHHLPALLLMEATGIELRAVAHQGSANNTATLLGKNVDIIVGEMAPSKGHIQEGTLRLLASFGVERLSEFPNVPTLKELYGVTWEGSLGWAVPKGVPEDVKKTLAATNEKAWSAPDFVKGVLGYGFLVLKLDGPAYAKSLDALKADTAKATSLLK